MISGKEALIALANDQDVEYMDTSNTFKSLGWGNAFGLETNLFFSDRFKFRLKPRTITINGIEVPAPFEPEEDDQIWYIHPRGKHGYSTDICCNHEHNFYLSDQLTVIENYGVWRTEEEIKQVVSALRSIFNPQ